MFGNPPEAAAFIAGMLNKQAGRYNSAFASTMNNPDKEQKMREQLHEVQQAIDCNNGCPYADRCAARNTKDRFPSYAGGKGGCLRYYQNVEGLSGFYLPSGDLLILTEEAIAALKGVLQDGSC